MWQSNSKVPAVLNVRACDMLAFEPAIGSGAPAGELSKKTLWGTSPKTKVTVPPTPIATFAGVKVFSEVAFTVAAMGGAPPGLLDDPGSVDELHAAASATTALVRIRVMRMVPALRNGGASECWPLTFADVARLGFIPSCAVQLRNADLERRFRGNGRICLGCSTAAPRIYADQPEEAANPV